jgi:hypothetical protein
MTSLRKLAKGRECEIRIPNHCLRSNETVVLCHLRIAGLSGIGMKAPDLFGAYGCHRCHAICDGQINSEFTYEERRLFLLEGMVRTQAILLREGKIGVSP